MWLLTEKELQESATGAVKKLAKDPAAVTKEVDPRFGSIVPVPSVVLPCD